MCCGSCGGGDPRGRWLGIAGWSGLTPSLLLLVWANAEAWPLYLPGRAFPGFPHGLELIIVPLFFVPVAMVFGTVAGGVVGRARQGDDDEADVAPG